MTIKDGNSGNIIDIEQTSLKKKKDGNEGESLKENKQELADLENTKTTGQTPQK